MNDTMDRRRRIGREALVAAVLALALPILGIGAFFGAAQTATPPATPAPCPAGTPTSATPTADLCVEIGEYDIYFEPNLITIPADTPVRIVLNNHGVTAHNFSVTDHENSGLKNLDISVDTEPGAMMETTINAPEGTYYFFCNVPGHEQAGMRGYIEVKKDAPIATSTATVTPRAG
jgi:uncharacterized cupredoxin-like copper-binding protein